MKMWHKIFTNLATNLHGFKDEMHLFGKAIIIIATPLPGATEY